MVSWVIISTSNAALTISNRCRGDTSYASLHPCAQTGGRGTEKAGVRGCGLVSRLVVFLFGLDRLRHTQ